MKKISFWGLLLISLGIIAICFFISKFILCKFSMNSDFLTASTTLIAALIAYTLFDDWKGQFRTGIYDRLKDRFYNLFNDLEFSYDQLFNMVVNEIQNENRNYPEIARKIIEFNRNIDLLIMELHYYGKIRKQFLKDFELKFPPNEVVIQLKSIMDNVALEAKSHNYNYDSVFGYLVSNVGYLKILELKRGINSDLQNIILSSIDSEQKGH